MTKKHTPGPWHANCAAEDKHNTSRVTIREPQNGDIIAEVNGGPNARLIAAAPDLFDALKHIIEEFAEDKANQEMCADPYTMGRINRARQAIAKAERIA